MFNSHVLQTRENFAGQALSDFELITGSRLVWALSIKAIDVGASIVVSIKNGFTRDFPFETVLTLTGNTVGFVKKVLTDTHNLFDIEVTVVGGNATYALGVSISDNALTTRIENAEIAVDLNHITQSNGAYDSVRLGNGAYEANVNPNGSLDVDLVNTQKDAMGRIQVSNPETLFSFSHFSGSTNRSWSELLVGSGTSVLDANLSAVKISTTTASGDKVSRKSYRNVEYLKGKAQQILLSCRPGDGQQNLRKRWGSYNADNGVFFEQTDGILYAVVRSKTSGVVVDTIVAQADFNLDKMDGSGLSKITLDLNKHQLFEISYTWLGTNIVRFGVIINGKLIYVHQFSFSNEISSSWAQYGIFPVAYEIENLGITATASDFFMSCGAVVSEGGDKFGFNKITSMDSGIVPIALTTTEKVCAGVRLKPGFEFSSLKPLFFQMLPASGSSNVYFKVLYNATLTNPVWADIGEISQGLTNNPSFTGGELITSGYLNLGSGGGSSSSKTSELSSDIRFGDTFVGSDVNDVSDTLIIVMRTISASGEVHFNASLKEFI